MIRVKIKRNTVLQEALTLESMGLPKILITLIKEDLERRTDQVRLGLILKEEPFTKETATKLVSKLTSHDSSFILKNIKSAEWTQGDNTFFQQHMINAMSGQYFKTTGTNRMPSSYWVDQGVKTERPLDLSDIKGMRKSFKKNIKRNMKEEELQGMVAELNNKVDDAFDEIIVDFYNSKVRKHVKGLSLISFLQQHPANEKLIVDMSWVKAANYAEKFWDEQELEEQIEIKYKKGFFWYNIGDSACEIEAERMGHCGDDERGILFSLREKRKNQRISESHVTLTYSEFNDTVYQIKGKGNCFPEPKYGPYIVDFLKQFNVANILENGDHSSCDFSEFIQYLERKYPEGNYEDPEQKVQTAIDAINNGNYNTEFLTFFADDMGYDMDEPMLRIDANVGFTVELDFLENLDADRLDFIEELWDDDFEVIKEAIIDQCDFEDYDTYSDGLDMTWDKQQELPRVVVSINLSPYNNDTARDLEDAEDKIRQTTWGYGGEEIADHEEKIKKIIYKQFEDVLNPDGREVFQQISNDIEKIQQELKIFNITATDEDEIDLLGYVSLPIKIKPITNGGKYSSIPYNKSTNFYQRMVTQAINFERYAGKLDDLVDLEHKKILAAVERQVKIPFADLDIEEPKKRFDKPYGFNMDIMHPPSMTMKKEVSHPRVKMTLTLSKLDNKATLLYCMQYIKFLEESLPNIINRLNFSQAQKMIDNAYKKAIIALHSQDSDLKENKKRKINVKIRR